MNLVDVADVAEGHLLAAARGRVGERCILGHRNPSLRQIFARLAAISGLPCPRLRLPRALPRAVAAVDTAWSRVSRRPPRVPIEAVRRAGHLMYFDADEAVRELRLPQSPVDEALRRVVVWFTEHGYV